MILKQLVLVGSKWESIPLNTNDSCPERRSCFLPRFLVVNRTWTRSEDFSTSPGSRASSNYRKRSYQSKKIAQTHSSP